MNGFPPGCWQAIRQNSIFESKGDTKPLMMLSSLKLLINWKANKRKELFTVGDRLQSQTPSWGQLLSPCPPWLCEEWRAQCRRFQSLETSALQSRSGCRRLITHWIEMLDVYILSNNTNNIVPVHHNKYEVFFKASLRRFYQGVL